MACGFPYAIAAQVAYPDRTVIAWVGDGGFTMLMGEMATCVKYKLPVKIFISQKQYIGADQVGTDGIPRESGVRMRVAADRFRGGRARFRHPGFTINTPSECAHVIESALATPGPVLVEAVVDANEPPMPARVKPAQALHFAESLAKRY